MITLSLMPRTLRSRLTMLIAASMSLLLAISGLLLYQALKAKVASMSENEMTTTLAAARSHLSAIESVDEVTHNVALRHEPVHGHQNVDLAIYDKTGKKLATTRGFRTEGAVLSIRATSTPQEVKSLNTALRYLVVLAPLAGEAGTTVRIAVQYDGSSELRLLQAYALSVLFVVVTGTLATAAVAYAIAAFGLRPLGQLTEKAELVSSLRLAQPLPVQGMAGELKDLSYAFNRMLARLDDSFSRLTSFSSDLAHDMRTPLTNLLAEAQVALSQPRSSAEYRMVIESSVDECHRLARMIDDMLFLARSDNSQNKLNFVKIDGRKEADRVAGFYEIMADDAGVSIEVCGEATFNGEPSLVQRAISNLVANAIAHAPEGTTVHIGCGDHGPVCDVSVTNLGRGIADEHIDRIFDRFFRADPSRHDSATGSGLGLAIVRSIMHDHGGDCTVKSVQNGQTTFRLVFPALSSDPEGKPFDESLARPFR